MHRLGSLLSHKPLLKPRTPLYSLISSSTFSYSPNSIEIFYDHLLKSCKGSSSLKQIHSALTTAGLITTSPHLSAQIIIKYAKCGDLNMARLLFDNINVCYDEPTSFLCNTMIRAYANVGQCFETIKLYSFMRKTGTFVNNYTYPFVFKACALNLLVREGKVVHGDALKNGFGSDLYVEAGLVDMYAKCGLFVDCRKLFDEMSTKDLVCWTAMITAYEQAEKPVEALILFKKMQQEEGLLADSIAVVSVASAVGQLGDVRNAQTVHGYAFRKSLIEELCVAFSMIEYGKDILGFHTADQENPYRHEVYKKMESLAIEMKMAGYVADLSCALHDVEEEDKEHMLNYHSEKLALAFGILKIDHGMVPAHRMSSGERQTKGWNLIPINIEYSFQKMPVLPVTDTWFVTIHCKKKFGREGQVLLSFNSL
ncbi:hypothetical protein OIU84_001373 [Salix udensis]|uniref:DYW domain-containing protein n=1 Tax=Salix udensis TaxID=889485 RepID=A0AAD6K895_9ROSI|nr:hypothetical protein OIU84_001373 [Salix udensis]